MALIKTMAQIIKDTYLAPDRVRVWEENFDSNGKSFIMENPIESKPSIPYSLYRFENPETLFPYFDRISGLGKMCDYVLFAEWENQEWCLLIELKKGNADAHDQLEAGEAFMRFVVGAAERIGKSVRCNEVQFRKIRIGENTNAKGEQKSKTPAYTNGYLNLLTNDLHLRYLLR